MSELVSIGARRAGRILIGVVIVLLTRLGDPLLWHVLCEAYVGIRMWLALYLSNEKVRGLAPWRT